MSDPRHPEPERPQFDMVLRGYDRIEVDQYIDAILQENAALRRELETSRRAAAEVQERSAAAPPQPTPQPTPSPTPHYDVDTPAEESFGYRAEKLLRLAEREAAEMRTRATRDVETMEAAARRRADEQVRAAEEKADEVRAQASQDVVRLKKQASQEAARLGNLYRTTRGELRRLAGLLNAEVERPEPEGAFAQAGEAGEAETSRTAQNPTGQNPTGQNPTGQNPATQNAGTAASNR
jgi:DivIVA domain-containing protein